MGPACRKVAGNLRKYVTGCLDAVLFDLRRGETGPLWRTDEGPKGASPSLEIRGGSESFRVNKYTKARGGCPRVGTRRAVPRSPRSSPSDISGACA